MIRRATRASRLEAAERLLAQSRGPIARTLERLKRHAAEIRRDWQSALEEHLPDAAERTRLLTLALPFGSQGPMPGADIDPAIAALERQGERLARGGVSAEHMLAAVALHLESALPYAVARRRGAAEAAAALARFSFIARLALTSGFATARVASWRAVDDGERRRLSRDLHDDVGHQLVVLKLYLELLAQDFPERSDGAARRKLQEAMTLVGQVLQSIKRLILDLGPAVLEEVGLPTALRLYARQFATRTGVHVEVHDGDLPRALTATEQTALYRLMQGALSNVLKHASASSVRIILGSLKETSVVMIIEDDGVGFEVSRPRPAFGLEAMRERIETLGGHFRIDSHPAGAGRKARGTRIEVDLPLEERDSGG
jgi:signal transduction histidine kinase